MGIPYDCSHRVVKCLLGLGYSEEIRCVKGYVFVHL